MKNDNLKYLVGTENVKSYPLEPFAKEVCSFLDDLSKKIRNDARTRKFPDVSSFSFWCRNGNISKLKEKYCNNEEVRIGRGIVFHVAPSNVPVNFAFSFVFGLLSGNSNIVRVSTKEFEQVDIICDCLNKVLELEEYKIFREMIAVVRYSADKEITDYFSGICDARVVWGGDQTILEIRKSPIKSRTVEINFADRFSFAIVNPKTILGMSESELIKLGENFYNDTYLMDQNACSTPHLIVWKTDNKEECTKAKGIFWNTVYKEAEKYNLAEIKVSDKYTSLCEHAIQLEEISDVHRMNNRVYVITLEKLPEQADILRGKYGEFFECSISELDELTPYMNGKIQTCICCGVGKSEVIEFILKNHIHGIDRIVPFGESLNIGLVWDGYDIIRYLSRVIG